MMTSALSPTGPIMLPRPESETRGEEAPEFEGKPLSKTDQVWMIGNAVPPVMSRALVSANDAAPVYRRASA